MPPRKKAPSLQSQCARLAAWRALALLGRSDKAAMKEAADYMSASVGHLVKSRLADEIVSLFAKVKPASGNIAEDDSLADLVHFIIRLKPSAVNFQPLTAMSMQEAETAYQRL